jgi:hypothetical protein
LTFAIVDSVVRVGGAWRPRFIYYTIERGILFTPDGFFSGGVPLRSVRLSPWHRLYDPGGDPIQGGKLKVKGDVCLNRAPNYIKLVFFLSSTRSTLKEIPMSTGSLKIGSFKKG